MGAGRKTETYYLPEKSKHASTTPTPNSSLSARNLKKTELGGVIFGCKHNTMKECFEKQLFGLPHGHISYVRNISPGLPLFLFNYSERKLYGIFEAVSTGRWNIDPHGWTEGGTGSTPFPAQVKFKTRLQCQPLLEDQFAPVIAANYYERAMFWFELDQGQTNKLISLFSSSPVASSSSLPGSTTKKMTLVPYSKPKDGGTEKLASDLKVASQKQVSTHAGSSGDGVGLSYSSILKNDSPSYSSILKSGEQGSLNEKDSKKALEHSVETECLPTDDQFNSTWEFPCLRAAPKAKLNSSEVVIDESGKLDEQFECLQQQMEDLYSSVAMDDSSSLPQSVPSETLPTAYAECGVGYLPTRPSESNASWPHKSEVGNNCLPEVDLLSNVMLPSDVHFVVDKIQEEVNKLKLKLSQQEEKISSLGKELVLSRTEIKYLKEQLKTSGCIPSQETSYAIESDSESIVDESILIIGGFNGLSHATHLESYCPSRDLLVPLCAMNSTRSYTATVKLKDDVYVIGGFDDNLWYDTVESYNVAENKWVTHPSLNRKKGSLAAISLNGKIYAIGGGNGVECFSEVELFDPDVRRWIPIRSMLSKRLTPAAAELNGMIYVVGGFDGVDYMKSVERYDPRENSWSRLESMSIKRGCHSLAVFNDKLYAIGGYNGARMVSTVEVFDPRIGLWIMGESMNTSRGYFSAVVTENSILVIGGVDENGFVLNTVERYEEGYGWETTNLKAIGRRCKFSVVPLSG